MSMCYTEKIDKVFLVRFAGEALQNLSYYYPEKKQPNDERFPHSAVVYQYFNIDIVGFNFVVCEHYVTIHGFQVGLLDRFGEMCPSIIQNKDPLRLSLPFQAFLRIRRLSPGLLLLFYRLRSVF